MWPPTEADPDPTHVLVKFSVRFDILHLGQIVDNAGGFAGPLGDQDEPVALSNWTIVADGVCATWRRAAASRDLVGRPQDSDTTAETPITCWDPSWRSRQPELGWT